MRTRLLLLAAPIAVLLTSCASSPQPPAPGSPAFTWNAARAAYHVGDFTKTDENLLQLIRGDSEFAGRARPWSILVSAGLAQGYSDLADAYEAGARANRLNPTPFRKQVSILRSMASGASVEFTEAVHLFLAKDKDPNVMLAFEFPTGAATEPPNLRKVSAGMLMQDSETEQMQAAMLQRGVLLAVTRALDAEGDAAKTLERFKAGDPQTPRATFLYATAKRLFDQSALFGSTKLDQPNRIKMLCQQALEALGAVPETKDTKALAGKIQAALKKANAT
jgi:hypothetical protein